MPHPTRAVRIDQTGKEGMTFSLNARETVCGRTTSPHFGQCGMPTAAKSSRR